MPETVRSVAIVDDEKDLVRTYELLFKRRGEAQATYDNNDPDDYVGVCSYHRMSPPDFSGILWRFIPC
jgi:hypothetical protein